MNVYSDPYNTSHLAITRKIYDPVVGNVSPFAGWVLQRGQLEYNIT
jgi:hypothetical protein